MAIGRSGDFRTWRAVRDDWDRVLEWKIRGVCQVDVDVEVGVWVGVEVEVEIELE